MAAISLTVITAVLFLSIPAVHADEPRGGGGAAPASRYAEIQGFLRELVRKNPERARLIQIGVSDSGEVIEGIASGNGPVRNLVIATHHGNEYGSTEVAKAFAASVAENPIPDRTIFVIPVLNIGGYNLQARREMAGGASYDPNRDYPGPCGTQGPFRLKSTAALARWIDQEGIVTAATLHTFSPAVVYPWGITTQDLSTPYDWLFEALGKAATVESGYPVGNSSELIYPANGTFEDYAFWKHGIWALLFEIGTTHSPDPGQVEEAVRWNVPGLRRLMEEAPRARAEDHAFTGKCDTLKLRTLDREDE